MNTKNIYCLSIDIIDSTNELLKNSSAVRDSFNYALTRVLNPFLVKMDLKKAFVKFTGDGWLITIEESSSLTSLICLALLLKKKFNDSIFELTNINFFRPWTLRLGIANGQDIKVEYNNQYDFVGDSIRRGVRISALCYENEILSDFAVYRDTQRDFDYTEISIKQRLEELAIKKFEHDIGYSILGLAIFTSHLDFHRIYYP